MNRSKTRDFRSWLRWILAGACKPSFALLEALGLKESPHTPKKVTRKQPASLPAHPAYPEVEIIEIGRQDGEGEMPSIDLGGKRNFQAA